MPASAGHDATWFYYWEDDFADGSPSDANPKPFGADLTIETFEGSHNATRLFEPNNRQAQQIIEQEFAGSWASSFVLTNPWWLGGVLTEATTSGSEAPYTHTYDGETPQTLHIVNGTETTGVEREVFGAYIVSASISVDVMGNVEVSLDGVYADEEKDPSGTIESQPTIAEKALHFGDAQLQVDGDTLSLVQSIDLSIENNTDSIFEIGSRHAVDFSPKALEVTLSFTDIVNESHDHLDRFYGSSNSIDEPAGNEDAIFRFDNGESGEDKNSLEFEVADLFPDAYSRDGVGDPTADLTGSLSGIPATVTAEAENSESEAL